MFLVEYVQSRKGNKFNYCSGYYDRKSAIDFAFKLNVCANIDSVSVCEIDTSCADVIFRNDKNA